MDGPTANVANRIELSRFGSKRLLSGGIVHARLRRKSDNGIQLEYYGQVHWAGAHGMDRKYAAGASLRWRIVQNEKPGVFAGTGPFYEFENWTYRAVRDEDLPLIQQPVKNELLKIGSYFSYKHRAMRDVFFEVPISLHHQARPEEFFSHPRSGSSTRLAYRINKYLLFSMIYRNILDFKPAVPIDPWFHKFVSTITVTFRAV